MYLGTHSLGHAYKEKWKRDLHERALFNWNSSGGKVYLYPMDFPRCFMRSFG